MQYLNFSQNDWKLSKKKEEEEEGEEEGGWGKNRKRKKKGKRKKMNTSTLEIIPRKKHEYTQGFVYKDIHGTINNSRKLENQTGTNYTETWKLVLW